MQQETINDLIRDKLAQGTAFRFRVISGSMAPLIRVGDEVVVQRVGTAELRCGDIVLYTAEGAFRIHRLLARRSQGGMTLLVTKGDASLAPDPPWREEQLLGKVVAISREDTTLDLEGVKWRALNRLLGTLAILQVAALRGARRAKKAVVGPCPEPYPEPRQRVVEGNRGTQWGPLLTRIVAAPSRWLVCLTQFPQVPRSSTETMHTRGTPGNSGELRGSCRS